MLVGLGYAVLVVHDEVNDMCARALKGYRSAQRYLTLVGSQTRNSENPTYLSIQSEHNLKGPVHRDGGLILDRPVQERGLVDLKWPGAG